jgi:hypothetical protein
MWGLGQHTLLGIVVGYVAPRATQFTRLLLFVYEGPRTTHFTGYCCELCEVLGNTLYWASYRSDVGRLHQWVQNKPFKTNNSRKV